MTPSKLLSALFFLQMAALKASPVILPLDAQRAAGIRTESVERRPTVLTLSAPAQVVDPTPLIAAQHKLKALSQNLSAQEKIAAILEQRLARLEGIGQDLRRDPLEQARRELLSAKAEIESLTAETFKLKAELASEWGSEISDAVAAELESGKARLVRLSLPGEDLPQTAALEHQGKWLSLEYLSPAPKTDPQFYGFPHYYLAPAAPGLLPGMHLIAKLFRRVEAIAVSPKALVWQKFKPWVFVKTSPLSFERRALLGWQETQEGFWATGGIAPGEEVVVEGAQLLLAEESKAKVPDEDDAE